MAIKFGENRAVDFASGNLMTFAKSFSAMNGQPLDNREVWYDKAALEAAAQGTTMYVGQKVTFVDVENQKVYQYSVQLDGSLKEIGVAPVSDGATIAVDPETGIVSLYGVAGLDSSKTYVPSIVNGQLTWNEPDTSTAEGQQQAIDGLTGRVANAEGKITALEEAVGNAESGLVKAITDNADAIAAEVTNRESAVATVSGKADANTTAIAGLESRVTIAENKFSGYYTKDEANTRIAEEIGKQAHFSAKVVESEDDMTDPTVLYLVEVDDATGADIYNQYIVIDGVPTLIGDTTTDLKDYATITDVNSAIASAISTSEEATTTSINAVDEKADGVINDLNEFELAVADTYATKAELETTDKDVEALSTRIGSAETTASKLTDRVAVNEGAISALQEGSADLATRIGNLESVDSEKNVIAGVSNEFNVTQDTRILSITSIAQSKIIGLETALEGKVSRQVSDVEQEDGTTKQVEWTLLSPENQEKLKALVIGESGVEISGTVNAENVEGLDSYITGSRNNLAGLYPEADASKLLTIEVAAQSNRIETIKVAGVAASITDKTVDIPFAALNVAGVVKSSSAENGVTVAGDGTMSVNSVNVNKLVQTEGDELIIYGGSATI